MSSRSPLPSASPDAHAPGALRQFLGRIASVVALPLFVFGLWLMSLGPGDPSSHALLFGSGLACWFLAWFIVVEVVPWRL